MWAHIDSRAASAKAAKAAAAAAAAVETDETPADETVESVTAAAVGGESLCFSSVLNDVASNVSCAVVCVYR
jgi:hypothetical protein